MPFTKTVSLFDECTALAQNSTNYDALFRCIADQVDANQQAQAANVQTWLLVITAAMVFFMQAGFAMVAAGGVRIKNVQNTMLKNLLDACGSAISFWALGFAFSYGSVESDGTTFIGNRYFFLLGDVNYAYFLFQYAFCASATTIVAGTLAERCQMAAYLCYALMISAFVYPVIIHAIWSNNGFLSHFNSSKLLGTGCIDFAGGLAVHTTGGATALWAALILGPRRGRFYDSHGVALAKPKSFPGHSVALQMLGAFILWFGWYGFNPGSALTLTVEDTGKVASRAAVTTTVGAGAGAISALIAKLYLEERRTGETNFSALAALNGALSGAVCITPGSGVLEPWAAVLMGALAGIAYLGGSELLIRLRIDDAVDAIPVHLCNGVLGILGVGFLASPRALLDAYNDDSHAGFFYELGRGSWDASLLACQVIAILFVFGWVFVTMFPFFIWLNYMGWLRSDSLEELVGLDISYHGGSAINTEQVKAEYLDVYNKNKSNIRRRGRTLEENRHPVDVSFGNRYDDERGESVLEEAAGIE